MSQLPNIETSLLSPRHGIFIILILNHYSKFSTNFPVHHEETILDQSGTNIFITYECCNERLSTTPRKYNKYKDNRALLYLLVLYVELDSLIQQFFVYAL